MGISLKWMALSASLAILVPNLAANAQTADSKLNVPKLSVEIPQELQLEGTHPKAQPLTQEPNSVAPKSILRTVNVSNKMNVSVDAIANLLRDRQLEINQPVAQVAVQPDTAKQTNLPKLAPQAVFKTILTSPANSSLIPQKNDVVSATPKKVDSPTLREISNKQGYPIALAKIEPDVISPLAVSHPEPLNSTAKVLVAANLGSDNPLVVPTTPSQVRIDRTQPITLQEALDLANKNNRDIIQARITVERTRAVLQEAEAARLPTANAQAGYTFSDSASARQGNITASPLTAALGGLSSTVSQPLSGTVGVTYNVFNSGLVEANVRAAENQLRIAEADLNRITQTVRVNIVTAYYNLQNTDETVRIRQKSVENAQRSLQDTTALERAGVGTRFDVLQSQVQLANAQQSLLDAQASQLVARRDLARQLEYPSNLDLSAADRIEPAPDWKLSLEDSILLAVKNRSELDIQRLQREVARERARAALARLGPQVNLTANFDLADDLSRIGGVSLGYRLGANVSMVLFDGGVANAQANQARADQALAESRFEQAASQARFDVEQAYINLQSRRGQIETATRAVEQSTEALRLARLRLSAGVGTQLEVIRAEEDLTRADVNRLQAVIGFNLSLANLQRAINGL